MLLTVFVARCCGPVAFEGDGEGGWVGGREGSAAVGVFSKPLTVVGRRIITAVS